MAFKITKQEVKRRDELVEQLREKFGRVEDEMNALKEQLAKLSEDVNQAVREYNAVREEANTFVEAIRDRMQESYDEKSERWQESDAASEAMDFISSWELELDELEEVTLVEPDEPQTGTGADELAELPESAQG